MHVVRRPYTAVHSGNKQQVKAASCNVLGGTSKLQHNKSSSSMLYCKQNQSVVSGLMCFPGLMSGIRMQHTYK